MAMAYQRNGRERKSSTDSWMSNLPQSLHDWPLTKLAIPGSHNSGTFQIDQQRQCATDTPGCIQTLAGVPGIGSVVTGILQRWFMCQNLNFSEQLGAGIRFFDLRVSSKPESESFYFVHTLYGVNVSELVQSLLTFLDKHPHEIVLLDFNHFYAMERKHHRQLVTYLIKKFGAKLCSQCECDKLTLRKLWAEGKQIIIFYQSSAVRDFEEVWPREQIWSLWPRTVDKDVCIRILDECYSQPPFTDFHVCQGVLTPTTGTVITGIFSNGSVKSMTEPWIPLFSSWVQESHRCCAYPLNIVLTDFVEKENFIQKVIDLNYKRIGQ